MSEACRANYRLLEDREENSIDVPGLDLIGRAAQHLKSPTGVFNPVVELVAK